MRPAQTFPFFEEHDSIDPRKSFALVLITDVPELIDEGPDPEESDWWFCLPPGALLDYGTCLMGDIFDIIGDRVSRA